MMILPYRKENKMIKLLLFLIIICIIMVIFYIGKLLNLIKDYSIKSASLKGRYSRKVKLNKK